MARKRSTPEQIIRKLREAEVFIAEGVTAGSDGNLIGIVSWKVIKRNIERG